MSDQDELEERPEELLRKAVVYTLPGMKQVTIQKDITYKTVEDLELKLDVYAPAQQGLKQLPAVILIHGDGPEEMLREIRGSGQYVSWGRLIAASGMVAVVGQHRSTEALHNVVGVANDIDDLISYVRDHSKALHIDADTLGIWVCSVGGPFGMRAGLYEAPTYVRCIVSFYSVMELRTLYETLYGRDEEVIGTPPTFTEEDFEEVSATELLRQRMADVPPIFIARAGLDYAELNEALDVFIAEALQQNVELDVMNHPTGQHGFDVLDDVPRTYEIIEATLAFLKKHLLVEGRKNSKG